MLATAGFEDVTSADLLVVPGEFGVRHLLAHEPTLEWIRAIDATTRITASVCTGAWLLGAAGLLRGRPATTHWGGLARLAEWGATPTRARWVESGKYFTAAGVSAGIDLALHLVAKLAGDDAAKLAQLTIEYDPAPPFAAGTPEGAGPAIVAMAVERSAAARRRLAR